MGKKSKREGPKRVGCTKPPPGLKSKKQMDYAPAPGSTVAAKSALGKRGKKAAAREAAWALLNSANNKPSKAKAPLHPGKAFKDSYGRGFAH